MKLYKDIKRRGSNCNIDEFEELIEKYNRMCKIIHHMFNMYRKAEYQHWINNGIKLISKIVSKRISVYGLKNNFIRPEQFGFRNKEEGVSLFISIREICQRRKK